MKHLSILLFLLGVLASAQEPKPNVSDIIICETIDHTGFISVSEKNFFEVFYFVKDSTFERLRFSIDINGTTDSVFENYSRVPNLYGQVTSVPVTGVVDHKTTQMKAISISNRTVNLPTGNDSAMLKNFKAERVFIPKSLTAKKGDKITIKNYVAIMNDTCYAGENTRQKAAVYGEYVLNPNPIALPKNNRAHAPQKAPKHNRDASGRFFTKKPNYYIEY